MNGTEILASLPPTAVPAREQAILAAVQRGDVVISFVDVTTTASGHTATLSVSADALRLGTAADSFRVSATARTVQQIADALDCVLPTSRICDLIWEQAVVKLVPCEHSVDDPTRVSTALMERYHVEVEAQYNAVIQRQGAIGLIENVGKHWVLTNKIVGRTILGIQAAANYGWYSDQGGPSRDGPFSVVQPLSTAHFIDYVDYSQVIRLVQQRCTVDGQDADLRDVLRDPALAALVSDEGPLAIVRIPGV